MQAKLQEQLSAADAKVILERLPERIQAALIARAASIEYPIEAVIEMAFDVDIGWVRTDYLTSSLSNSEVTAFRRFQQPSLLPRTSKRDESKDVNHA